MRVVGGHVNYEWNAEKNEKNYSKLGIWFEEACTVFVDPNALEIFDEDHSFFEERFIVLGMSTLLRLLVVVYCERSRDDLRIITARKATKREVNEYEKGI
jgi:uncharacterized protein